METPVLTREECAETKSDLWDWMESLQRGIDRANPETWRGHAWPKNIHGIIEYPPASHTRAVWKVRANAKILAIFARLYKTDDLLVSFDRVCIHKPSANQKSQKKWLHIDQAYATQGFRCVQGFVTLEDMPAEGGTLQYIPGSAAYHKEFFEAFPARKKVTDDWLKFTEKELEWFRGKGLKVDAPSRVAAKAGQLVLWDSRTVHCGAYAQPGFQHLWRWVVYVCYAPRKKGTPENLLKKKRSAFEEGRQTSHWPAPKRVCRKGALAWKGIKMFPVKPQWSQNQQDEPEEGVDKITTVEELRALGEHVPALAGF